MMRLLEKLLCFVLLAGVVLCGEASAKQPVICATTVTGSAAEAKLESGARTYRVKVTCTMSFTHCKTGLKTSEVYNATYTGDDAITVEKGGREEAEKIAKIKMLGEAQKKLEEQCKVKGCSGCTNKGCKCGCGS